MRIENGTSLFSSNVVPLRIRIENRTCATQFDAMRIENSNSLFSKMHARIENKEPLFSEKISIFMKLAKKGRISVRIENSNWGTYT